MQEASNSDIAKKASQITEDLSKTVSHNITEKAQEIGKTGAFQSISQATKAVQQEIDNQTMQGKFRPFYYQFLTYLIFLNYISNRVL